tara:strand:+ start:116 stop:802 length:687 start_codon:yes stop_codon:yes gene_type:complete
MKNKLSSLLPLLFIMLISLESFASKSSEMPKTFINTGISYLYNEGFDNLKGNGRTVDGNDDATYFTVGYRLSPSLDFEFGVINFNEISSSMYSGASGTLNGKNYSVSKGCAECSVGGNDGVLELKGEFETSYLLGFQYNTSSNKNVQLHLNTGILLWDAYFTATGAQFVYDGNASSGRFLEVDGSDAYFAIGASYRINNKSKIAFEYLNLEIFDSNISGPALSWTQNF